MCENWRPEKQINKWKVVTISQSAETVEHAQKKEQMIRPAGSFPRFVSLFIFQSL